MLLAIDIGNTRTKAISMGTSISIATADIKAHSRLVEFLAGCPPPDTGVIASCVVPEMRSVVETACREAFGVEVLWLTADLPLGLKIRYETPDTLGSDRIAAVLGAVQLYEVPLVVVDCGTATKIEAVNRDGEYLGGAIMPGIGMGLECLYKGTGQLPHLEATWPNSVIGRNTRDALLSGTVRGHVNSIAGLVREFEADLGPLKKVVFTGGYLTAFYRERRRTALKGLPMDDVPFLTLAGLLVAGKRLGLISAS